MNSTTEKTVSILGEMYKNQHSTKYIVSGKKELKLFIAFTFGHGFYYDWWFMHSTKAAMHVELHGAQLSGLD